jgi:HflK protein
VEPLEVIEFLFQMAWETWFVLKEASVFLLLGFTLAGVLAVLVPSQVLMRFLGVGKIKSVLWAAAIGTPLPLCSCGVLPTALGLTRQGATKGAAVSFLISTPETGVDSIALSYALMDPLITVFRPVAAYITAVVAGIATNLWGSKRPRDSDAGSSGGQASDVAPPSTTLPGMQLPPMDGNQPPPPERVAGIRQVLAYAFGELLDETAHWLVLGILLAALVAVLLPASLIERYLGGGLTTMLAMLAIGIPIYTCASASTPVAAALVLKGLSPGAALVFLLSGPATNLGTIVVLLKFLGYRVVAIYLAAIAGVSLLAGYGLDWVYQAWHVNPVVTFGKATQFVPEPLKVAGAIIFIGALVVSLWRAPLPAEWVWLRDGVTALTGMRLTAVRLKAATIIAVVALYFGSGVFTVQPGEVGLKTRFGQIVAANLGPGLHYRLPWPIEGHRLVQHDRIRRIEVGFRSMVQPDSIERALARQRLTVAGPANPVPAIAAIGFWYQKDKVPDEALLLTGDENIIEIVFTVQYQIKDPLAYTYNVADPDGVVRSVTISALRAVVATMNVDAVYTSARRDIEQKVVQASQALLDAYHAGVRLDAVSLLSVHAPEEVHAAFRDVASAQEDKMMIIERATTFAQEGVNLAAGDAAAMIESALAFKEQRVLEAEGNARAFSLRQKEYARAPDLTRFRLHLEALEQVLAPAQKILRPGAAEVKEFDLWLLQPLGKKGP